MVVFFDSDFEPKAWHIFLIYQAVNILILLYNIFLMKRTSWIHDVGCMSIVSPMYNMLIVVSQLSSPSVYSSSSPSPVQRGHQVTTPALSFGPTSSTTPGGAPMESSS